MRSVILRNLQVSGAGRGRILTLTIDVDGAEFSESITGDEEIKKFLKYMGANEPRDLENQARAMMVVAGKPSLPRD